MNVLAGFENSTQGKPGRILHTPLFIYPTKQEEDHMIPGNQISNDPTRSIVDAQTPLIEAVNSFDEVGAYAATTNDLNDLADHERQGSLQGYNHLLSVLILHNEAERNTGPNFGFSSRGRQ